MTPKELAEKLTGSEYPFRLSEELRTKAQKAGLVVVYGGSDDLIEFEGAIDDERGASDQEEILLDEEGLAPDFAELCDARDLNRMRDYFSRERNFRVITTLWDRRPYSWTYETSIPHETFEVIEDGEPYCQGLVFSLSYLGVA